MLGKYIQAGPFVINTGAPRARAYASPSAQLARRNAARLRQTQMRAKAARVTRNRPATRKFVAYPPNRKLDYLLANM